MTRELELHCRDDLRGARAAVLRDAEAFPEVLFAIERTGASLLGRSATLDAYRSKFMALVARRKGTKDDVWPTFSRLYDLVQHGRNEALHQGAAARHLGSHVVALALELEEALAGSSDLVSDYMVRSPLIAELWQPLRLIRHQMLLNSFSHLPVKAHSDEWAVVSDAAIARVVRDAGNQDNRAERLGASLRSAMERYDLRLTQPLCVGPRESVRSILARGGECHPVLVVSAHGELLGIATPFDFL